MDPKFLDYYNQELLHLRDGAAEFARENPKIAARLALTETECADPYVERLLEGFAFLTARLQLRIDAEFPRFTQHLLEMVYPDFLPPTPAMAIAQFVPEYGDGGLARGYEVPRGTTLTAGRMPEDATSCEFRTAHALALWPLQISSASYRQFAADLPSGLPLPQPPQAVLRIGLRATAGLKFSQIALRSLPIFLGGVDQVAHRIYEQVLGRAMGLFAMPAGQKRMVGAFQPPAAIRERGFGEDEALLAPSARTFQGHRLLQEYIAFAPRYLFVELAGFEDMTRYSDATEVELVIPLSQYERSLEGVVEAADFSLYCTPIVNLLNRRADRIHVTERTPEHHVVPDVARPMDFEVYRVTEVTGYGDGVEARREFQPFYATHDEQAGEEGGAYYTLRRAPRVMSERQRRVGTRSGYLGSEVYLSLVDQRAAPYSAELRQLGVSVTCTNRDLPLRMPIGGARGDFSPSVSGPIGLVRCVKGPSPPLPAHAPGEASWRLIALLSQNYVSLLDSSPEAGAEALRELLMTLYVRADPQFARHLAGLRSIATRQIVRRLPTQGPVAFGRGVGVTLTVDEALLGGSGAFLFGSVLRHYLARHASLNSFVETTLDVAGRGEIMRWMPVAGRRPIL